MAGFRKARGEQAALKMALYGPPGSGKTFTALLLAEGLAKARGGRVAFVDTERGTDFYAKDVPARKHHPNAFDFDALYSRSLTEVLADCQQIDPAVYSVLVIDSITHLWEAAVGAYKGKRTSADTIPAHAWSFIKKPYKALMSLAVNSPMHVLILGRQGNEWAEGQGGEMVNVGFKMKAEGETAYEPHLLVRMESTKPAPAKGRRPDAYALAVPAAFVEKDRTGVLQGQYIEWPDFQKLAAPLLPLLGGQQAQIATDDETAARDAEALGRLERQREADSRKTKEEYEAKFRLAKTADDLKKVGQEVTPEVKKRMLAGDVDALGAAYREALQRLGGK